MILKSAIIVKQLLHNIIYRGLAQLKGLRCVTHKSQQWTLHFKYMYITH